MSEKHRESARQTGLANRRHGMHGTATYRAWVNMRVRCLNPNNRSFQHYGGRGISVCPRWSCFENFLEDIGERPGADFSLDRIDVNGNYEPTNVKWSTSTEQARNQRRAVLSHDVVQEIRGRFEHGESQLSIATRLGLKPNTIHSVVRNRSWREAGAV